MERTSLIKLDKKIIKETSLLAFPIIQGLVYELQSLTDKAFDQLRQKCHAVQRSVRCKQLEWLF